jgi:putative MATE family efflux protein
MRDLLLLLYSEENIMNLMEQDLTAGNITKQLIRFGIPLFFANLLQSFYSIVDMLVVGHVVGSTGLAAISNASMISFIINSICTGVTMGGTVLAARCKGAGDRQGQRETIGTLFSLSAGAAVLVTLAGLAVYPPVFRLLGVPEAAMKDACDYMFIICCGTICVFGYNAVCAVMRGMGDSRSPLYFVLVATAVNIILDILLVGVWGMGTKGAAYATVFSQGLSFAVSVVHLRRRDFVFDFRRRSFAVKWDRLVSILSVGLPSAVQMVVVNLSYLLITGMFNAHGMEVAAAAGIGLKVNTFAGMPCWAVGQAVTAMTGQNMGAGETGRVRETVRTGLAINLAVTLCAVLAVQVYAVPILSLFAPSDQAVVQYGVLYLRICCCANSLVYAVMYTYDSFAAGVGAAYVAMANSLFDSVVARLALSWLLGSLMGLGFTGICLGQALSPLLPALAGAWYFRWGRWEKKMGEAKEGQGKNRQQI